MELFAELEFIIVYNRILLDKVSWEIREFSFLRHILTKVISRKERS